jgi:hypothetical protein
VFSTAMNLQVQQMAENFLTFWVTVSFSRSLFSMDLREVLETNMFRNNQQVDICKDIITV